MFRMLGKFVTRSWPVWLVLWGVLIVAGNRLAPSWDEVAAGGTFEFLPDDSPSRRAEALVRRSFHDGQADAAIVIVANRADAVLRPEDEAFVRDRLVPGLQRIADEAARGGSDSGGEAEGGERPAVVRIRSLANDVERPVLISEDLHATIVQVELSTSFMEQSNALLVRPVRAFVERLRQGGEAPDGLELAVTGSAVVGFDINNREEVSARAIERWTIWWVFLLLLVVHRAPLLALAQMVTVYVAMESALDLMAWMAGRGWIGLFESLDVYTTVLVYGAGVDYSLFLISRYRERLEAGDSPREAMAGAIDRVGLAVTISAGTAIVAVGTLGLADFGMFAQAGFTIPFGLFIMLLASLTVTPALLLLLGRAALWPSRAGTPAEAADGGRPGRWTRGDPLAGLWRLLGGGLRRRPGLIWSLAVLAMLPFAGFGAARQDEVSYAPMSEIPGNSASVAAIDALQEHFPAGIAGPLTAVIRSDAADFASDEGTALIDRLTDRLMERKDELGIARVLSVAEGFGASETPQEEAEQRERTAGVGQALGAVGGAIEALVPGDVSGLAERSLRERAVSEYVGGEGGARDATKVVIVPAFDPFDDEALDRVGLLESAVRDARPEGLADAEVALAGAPVSLRDLRDVTRSDRDRIYLWATAGVAAVLVVLLRRVAVSLYMLFTVLLSYLVTLGVTVLVFRAIDGAAYDGIDWTVPVFLFTLLMAIGADYNVFLLARVDEERDDRGPVEGVIAGLAKTGGIISGCGLIMAGTFASLIWGGALSSLDQLGFALTFGVLLDTFVVRPLLVPSYLVLVSGGRLGALGRRLAGDRSREPAGQPAGAAASE